MAQVAGVVFLDPHEEGQLSSHLIPLQTFTGSRKKSPGLEPWVMGRGQGWLQDCCGEWDHKGTSGICF